MRVRLLGSMAIACALSCGTSAEPVVGLTTAPSTGRPVPVLVELFTSEGCSSCPPADDVLTNLIRNQPVKNVTIIGFGEHVDYWDNLGWRDAFSAPTFTARQSEYERTVFHAGSVYTPQVVVDGRFQVVGSDVAAVRRAIVSAAAGPKAAVSVKSESSATSDLAAQIAVAIPSTLTPTHPLDVIAAIVERNVATRVQRGENGGRLLKHGAVVRQFVAAGAMNAADRSFSKAITVPLDAAWKRPDVQLVAFVQDRTTKAIVGAATDGSSVAASGQ